MARKFLEIATTPAVLAAQEQAYGRAMPVAGRRESDRLGPHEVDFIAARDSFYMASITETGWPYVQHRGGAPGFLRVLDPTTLAFADYSGNHQLLSTGNLTANDRTALFLMDYPNRRRLKILGRVRITPAHLDPELLGRVAEAAERGAVERILVITVEAFDWNCPKYITPRFTAAEIRRMVEPLTQRIAELEQQLAARA